MKRSNSTSATATAEAKELKDIVSSMTYTELLNRKEEIHNRLKVVAVEKPTITSSNNSSTKVKRRTSKQSSKPDNKNSGGECQSTSQNCTEKDLPAIKVVEKTIDVHWDFTMKEMMWLATDFQAERKRQISLAKKIATAVKQHHKTRESRRLRELAEAELKRRRLAARIGREVKGWWTKIERVIAYKQKCSADEERRKAMNKQLVTLVKQTEKYTESLIKLPEDDGDDDDDLGSSDYSEDSSTRRKESKSEADNSDNQQQSRKRRRKRKKSTLSIEEALSMGERSRRSKNKVVDYNRLHLEASDDRIYGESTASDTASDGSFSPDDSDGWTDDEETLLEAEILETKERMLEIQEQRSKSGKSKMSKSNPKLDDIDLSTSSFKADPRELRILEEEQDMPIEEVMERYRTDMESTTSAVLAEADHSAMLSPSPATDASDEHENVGRSHKEEKGDESEDMDKTNTSLPHRTRSSRRDKKVTFDPNMTKKNGTATENFNKRAGSAVDATASKYDADDDGDASDVEDFVDHLDVAGTSRDDDDGSDEFEADENEVDDETTIAVEEGLPKEMTAGEEINLLKAENEMSVDELRKLYAGAFQDADGGGSDEEAQAAEKPFAPKGTARTVQSRTAVRDATNDIEEPSDSKLNGGSFNDDKNDRAEGLEADQNEDSGESTMAQEEISPREMSAEEETTLLKPENENSAGELRKLHAASLDASLERSAEGDPQTGDGTTLNDPAYAEQRSSDLADLGEAPDGGGDEDHAGDEFVPMAGGDMDDETTIEAEEKLGRDLTYEEELKLLQDENEIPVEKLRAMYASALNEDEEDLDDAIQVEGDDDTRDMNTAQGSSLSNVLITGDNQADLEDQDEEDEFEPELGEGVDDETTIEAEERLGREMSYEDEIALLEKENEMSVEELRAKYAGLFVEDAPAEAVSVNRVKEAAEQKYNSHLAQLTSVSLMDDNSDATDENEEFIADIDEVDDETTMEAEERLGREMSPEEELAILLRDNETPIERLHEMYQKMVHAHQMNEVDSMDKEEVDEAIDGRNGIRKRTLDDSSGGKSDNLKKAKKSDDSDDGLAAIKALEESAERARQTLASRPFLLAPWVKMREYQQIGLNWLVSLQTRRLNGILADEMGLGKTLQTIALLGYLASYKGIWGPHLVIVPTSVIVNWETELKRFCPGLKALCYYGSAKRRKELRVGWTKTNWYHVVVTSYQLAVQDAFAFKRKRWYYLILDEAQNIKNFQSQRWQTLINFNTQRRLLLTGTPLQNNLLELWSLLHFLMPYIFRSRKEFSFWFSNPMNSMIEGTANQNDEMIGRLHGIIRPFVLRRLKKDVETQLPGKYEHIVKCPLSRRQMFFYEEFMARSSTRQALKKGGNYMGMMNVLMQLRKVVNHPDLFEPRSVVTPFVLNKISITTPVCVIGITNSSGVWERISQHLLSPLWCGSSATPSLASSSEHDEVRSKALLDLEDRAATRQQPSNAKLPVTFENGDEQDLPPALLKLLVDLQEKSNGERKATADFQLKINSMRCSAPPFPFPNRRLQSLRVQQHPVYQEGEDFLATPLQLLAMRRTQQDRADDLDEIIKNFVFCVPKAGAPRPTMEARKPSNDIKYLEDMLLEPLEDCLLPFRKAHARLTSFFPDKKLVQFDAGKLQTLAELLHGLKRGGHRVLIFTQMSKMLDILEAFLNLNGHTYVRLDGSTGVDRRQRLMDRFNNDPKIFTFILSTRSGGMGINLTGADTVIFYDSDWNPAMDAQAQDRAHRIGQTRDVHIYRLITEHSIEENILVKAQQKRNLDILVMDKGKFDGSALAGKNNVTERAEAKSEEPSSDVFTTGGLRAILGVEEENQERKEKQLEREKGPGENLSREQMEAAMLNLEDQDDVIALRGAQKEAAEELQEFDESIELKRDSDNEVDGDETENNKSSSKAKGGAKKKEEAAPEKINEEEQMAKEFEAWQDNVGVDASVLEASLSPTETYALRFREDIEPFWSVFAIMEERRRLEAMEETKDEIDIDQIEHEKALEERRAIEDGDLLATRPRPEELVRQRNLYLREKARLRANKKRRTLTGENWKLRNDAITDKPFWYNTDTGEAIWDKPAVLVQHEADEVAREKLWAGLPLEPLVHIMSFLVPFPDRTRCIRVCRQWRLAAIDFSFVRHVYPVEMGALARDDKQLGHNHYRSIAEALTVALPGDTIELGDGHYWVNEPGLAINVPLKLVGDEQNASNVVIEMSGTVSWRGKAGWIEGITFRRPKISSGEGSTADMLRVVEGGRIDIIHSVIDNTGSTGASAAALVGSGASGQWVDVLICGGMYQGILLEDGAKLSMDKCIIKNNRGHGISSKQSELHAVESRILNNQGVGAIVRGGSARFLKCSFDRNTLGVLKKEDGCKVNCNHNNAPAEVLARHGIPGFSSD